MRKSIEWMKSHPVVPFFLLALAIMYLLFIPALTIIEKGLAGQDLVQILILYMSRLAVYSPVLAGMLVTRWTLPGRSPVSAGKRRLTFWIVWLLALIVSTLDLKRSNSNPNVGWVPMLILSIPIALIPAFVVSSAFSRIGSLQEYLSSLLRPRGNWIWYLVALVTFPVIQILGVAITRLLAGQKQLFTFHLSPGVLLAALFTFASVFFYSGGINEEAGWRGFAQRHLQAKYSPLIANLLLWAFLVVWHIPNDILQYREGGYLLFRIGLYPFITILFGWIYNRTRGSVLAPVLFHASMNTMNALQTALPVTNASSVLLVLLAVLVVLVDRMWKKPTAADPVGNAA